MMAALRCAVALVASVDAVQDAATAARLPLAPPRAVDAVELAAALGAAAGVSPELLRDPTRGNFTDPADADVVRPVLTLIANRYAEYARSGSDAWDATVDVHARPDWLKRAAGVDPDAREATFLGDVPRFTENEDQWRARACSSPPRLAGAPATAPARLDWRGGDDATVRVDDGEEGGSLLCGDFSALNAALTTR